MVAKLGSTVENYLKKNESLALAVNSAADLKRALQSVKNYGVLVKRCPLSATIADITVNYSNEILLCKIN